MYYNSIQIRKFLLSFKWFWWMNGVEAYLYGLRIGMYNTVLIHLYMDKYTICLTEPKIYSKIGDFI